MKNVIRLALVDPKDASRASLKNLLLGLETVWLEAECSRYEFFGDVVSQTHPDIGVVALDTDAQKGLKLIESLHQNVPECAILVVSTSTEGQLILKAMRAGMRA